MKPVYIVDGLRTPFIKAKNKPNPFTNSDLATQNGKALLLQQPFAAETLDNVILGSTIPNPDEPNLARIVALRIGCGDKVPGWTVQRNCASGMQAIDSAISQIALGRNDLVLAGGVDAMSRAPLLFNDAMVNWFAAWFSAKSIGQRLALLPKIRPQFLAPIISLLRGLTDPVVGINMGQTAENLAYEFKLTRHEMDVFAMQSHARLAEAQDNGYFPEVTPIYDYQGKDYTFDDGLRRDTSLEKLAKLKPFFDKKFGMVTAGNSSQITDGSAMLILASAEAVKKHQLPVLAKIVDSNWAAVDPAVMGIAPVHATTPMLLRNNLKLSDIDYWEINEAFAAQVLACLKAWQSKDYCHKHFNLDHAMGEIDQNRLNVEGGAIAMGHPVGASGARITLQLANILKRKKAKLGVATICIGGGQGGALLLENVDGVEA
jgi:acetyl-CoA C-acetyltransferase